MGCTQSLPTEEERLQQRRQRRRRSSVDRRKYSVTAHPQRGSNSSGAERGEPTELFDDTQIEDVDEEGTDASDDSDRQHEERAGQRKGSLIADKVFDRRISVRSSLAEMLKEREEEEATPSSRIDMATTSTSQVAPSPSWVHLLSKNPVEGGLEEDSQSAVALLRHQQQQGGAGCSPRPTPSSFRCQSTPRRRSNHGHNEVQVIDVTTDDEENDSQSHGLLGPQGEQSSRGTPSSTPLNTPGPDSLSVRTASEVGTDQSDFGSEVLLRRQQRLEQSLERRQSSGRLAREPSSIAGALKQKLLSLKARVASDISSDVGQFSKEIENGNRKQLHMPTYKVLHLCDWVDAGIELMLLLDALPPSSQQGGCSSTASASLCDASSAKSELVPMVEEVPSVQMIPPTHSALPPPIASWDTFSGRSSEGRRSFSPRTNTQRRPSGAKVDAEKVIMTTLRVGEHEVHLTTAGLIPPSSVPLILGNDPSVGASGRSYSWTGSEPMRSLSPKRRGSLMSRGSLTLQSPMVSAMSPAEPAFSCPSPSARPTTGNGEVDEVEQLIFGVREQEQ